LNYHPHVDGVTKNGEDAIHLEQYVATYLKAQLDAIPQLVDQLGLDATSLIDHWKGQWTIIHISTPITVDNGRRVLLRLRPSFRVTLKDCPGLEEELSRQSRKPIGTKRGADLVSPLKARNAKAPRRSDSSTASTSRPQVVLTSDSDSDSSVSRKSVPIPQMRRAPTHKPVKPLMQPRRPPLTSSSRDPEEIRDLKWPFDRFTCDIDAGWTRIEKILAGDPRMTLKKAFPEVFGIPYARTTVWKYKTQWHESPKPLREMYTSFGQSPRGSYAAFNLARRQAQSKSGMTGSSGRISPAADDNLACRQAQSKSGMIGSIGQHLPATDDDQEDDDEDFPLQLSSSLAMPATSREGSDGRENGVSRDVDLTALQCPYCDEVFEFEPSPTLLGMQTALESVSDPSPQPHNPGHRDANSFVVYIDFCERHHVEATLATDARKENWPMEVDFSKLYDRICKLRPQLQKILSDVAQYHATRAATQDASIAESNATQAATRDVSIAESNPFFEQAYENSRRRISKLVSFEGHGAG
jgi:hypothetical protein